MNLKSRWLSAIICVALTSCSQDETRLWKTTSQEFNTRGRRPAQVSGQSPARCFKDRFRSDQMQAELETLDRESVSARDLKVGSWVYRGLSPKTISAITQNGFLDQAVAPYWFLFKENQHDCKELPCFVDRLYAHHQQHGLLHSYYVFKTGYTLSTLNAFPWLISPTQIDTQRVPGKSTEEYLFNETELRALWFHAQLLPKTLLHLPNLMTIHRLPHGYTPQEWDESGSCAASIGMWNQGYVVFSDGCLTLDAQHVFDPSQYFYVAFTHELGHRLSAWNFATSPFGPQRDLDQEPEFLNLSGWKEHTLVTAEGKTETQWVSSKDAKFITKYAASNPFEDFAESVAYFRTHANEMLEKAPEKYEYIKEKVYAGKGYSTDDLHRQYSEELKAFLVDSVDEWTEPCLLGQPNAQSKMIRPEWQALTQLLPIDLDLDDSMKECFQVQFVNQLHQGLLNIRYQEPEGCDHLNQHENEVAKGAALKAAPSLIQYFRTDAKMVDLLKSIRTLRLVLRQEFDGRTVFLSCLGTESPQRCYDGKIKIEADRLFKQYRGVLKNAENLVEPEKMRFLNTYAFSEVSAQVLEFYQSIVGKYVGRLDERAKSIWNECQSKSTAVVSDLVTEPYHGGVNTVPGGVLKCINQQITRALTEVESSIAESEGFDYFSPDASEWMKLSILFPRFKSFFDTQIQALAQLESKRILDLKSTVTEAVFAEVKTKLKSLDGCKTTVVQKLVTRFKPSSFPYTSLDPLFDELGNSICDRLKISLQASSRAKVAVIPSAAQKKDLDSVWKSIPSQILTAASARYEACAKRPNERERRFCLFTEKVKEASGVKVSWNWIKELAVKRWVKEPGVRKLSAKRGYSDAQMSAIAQARLEDERQTLTEAVFADFSRKAVSRSTR